MAAPTPPAPPLLVARDSSSYEDSRGPKGLFRSGDGEGGVFRPSVDGVSLLQGRKNFKDFRRSMLHNNQNRGMTVTEDQAREAFLDVIDVVAIGPWQAETRQQLLKQVGCELRESDAAVADHVLEHFTDPVREQYYEKLAAHNAIAESTRATEVIAKTAQTKGRVVNDGAETRPADWGVKRKRKRASSPQTGRRAKKIASRKRRAMFHAFDGVKIDRDTSSEGEGDGDASIVDRTQESHGFSTVV